MIILVLAELGCLAVRSVKQVGFCHLMERIWLNGMFRITWQTCWMLVLTCLRERNDMNCLETSIGSLFLYLSKNETLRWDVFCLQLYTLSCHEYHKCVSLLSRCWLGSRKSIRPVKNWLMTCLCGYLLPSVLWCYWLGGRKGIRLVKNWVVLCRHGYLSGARCRFAYGLADATATHYLLLQ